MLRNQSRAQSRAQRVFPFFGSLPHLAAPQKLSAVCLGKYMGICERQMGAEGEHPLRCHLWVQVLHEKLSSINGKNQKSPWNLPCSDLVCPVGDLAL